MTADVAGMTRAEIRSFLQGLQQQQPPLSLADFRSAVIERWLDDRGDAQDAGTETQTTLPGQHVLRVRKVSTDPTDRVPFGYSILHPVPDPDAPGGVVKMCPYNAVYWDKFDPLPDHKANYAVTLSANGNRLNVGQEVTL